MKMMTMYGDAGDDNDDVDDGDDVFVASAQSQFCGSMSCRDVQPESNGAPGQAM